MTNAISRIPNGVLVLPLTLILFTTALIPAKARGQDITISTTLPAGDISGNSPTADGQTRPPYLAPSAEGNSGGLAGRGFFDAKPPTQATLRANAQYRKTPLNYFDARDEERAGRGRMDAAAPPRVTKPDGSVVWDMGAYSFIKGDIAKPDTFPDTVNPSLWRQALLNAGHGLFEVAARDFGNGDIRRIYQVRGYDLANMTFVETKNGFIVVDVTSYRESAAAAVALLYDNLAPEKKNKKIHTVIYTHSHVDHYGGIYGVLQSLMVDDPSKVTIAAPDGFTEAAVSENLTVGAGMSRRAGIMYGMALRFIIPKGVPPERRQVNNGLAVGSGVGTSGLVPPTMVVKGNVTLTFDGTPVEFLLAPHTEAPAEMVMYFPEFRSLCLAEI
ncbi:MAG: MBL fold metallo-hydrolase, partial [Desulfovibrio sp.]|nr:MBL fold metallo-hydrolase [Desulfovibrio sp.]